MVSIMKKTIFVVDDSALNLVMAEEALEKHYLVLTMSSADKMFAILGKIMPDLILLDIEMPGLDGYETIKRLRASDQYAEIPVIFLTAKSDNLAEAKGIELGAVDFIVKPFSEQVLLNRIRNHLHIDELIRERTKQLSQRTAQLIRLQNSVVYALADVVENRDKNTGGHIDRTTEYTKILVDAMLMHGIYIDEMYGWDFDSIVSSARLHDLGKIAIPDSILNKPESLTTEEYSVIKTHSIAGQRIIEHMIEKAGELDFLSNARLFAAYHHERWDGTGYPFGLFETEIPLHGRIMALVDVYDALISERPYKKAFSGEEAVLIIGNESGKHFDPSIADIFCSLKDKLELAKVRLLS